MKPSSSVQADGANPAITRPYGGKSVAQRQKERKRALVKAGVELFGQEGFSAVSIDAICAKAGLTKRYFYEAFPSREALLTACYDSASFEFLQAIMMKTTPYLNDARKLVRAGLEGTFGFVLANPDKARLIMIEAMSVRGQLGEIYGKRYDQFVELLLQFTLPFLGENAPEKSVLKVMAKGMVGSLIHLNQGWIANDFKQPMQELIDGMEQIMAGIGLQLKIKGWER